MSRSFAALMTEFEAVLKDGKMTAAYQRLAAYIRELRAHFAASYPDYDFPGSIYYGYLDMTYFSILPPALKKRDLKVAVVFNYQSFRFEAWLSGRNRKAQKDAFQAIQEAGWETYRLTPNPEKSDSVLEHILAADPNFSDLDELTKQIERGTLDFIQKLENFFAVNPA